MWRCTSHFSLQVRTCCLDVGSVINRLLPGLSNFSVSLSCRLPLSPRLSLPTPDDHSTKGWKIHFSLIQDAVMGKTACRLPAGLPEALSAPVMVQLLPLPNPACSAFPSQAFIPYILWTSNSISVSASREPKWQQMVFLMFSPAHIIHHFTANSHFPGLSTDKA